MVIGANTLDSTLGLSLLADLFVSDHSEALSGSMGMCRQDLSFRHVLFIGTRPMVRTGIGAALGNLFFVGASMMAVALIQGLVAGAMLTMIAGGLTPRADRDRSRDARRLPDDSFLREARVLTPPASTVA